jgi:hypothetical protein
MVKIMPMRSVPERHLFSELFDGDPQKLVNFERDDMAERDATYWLQLIRSYAGPAPVVVALNKSGGRAREMDRRTLEEIHQERGTAKSEGAPQEWRD